MNFANMFRGFNNGIRVERFAFIVMVLTIGVAFSVYAGKDDCTNIDGDGDKPIKEVGKEDVGVVNDYDEVVEEDDRKGVIYLALIGGSQPKANACGLIPKNDAGQWTGWGGPLNFDNVTIGEGGATRNHIVIGGTYFERGFGAHAVGTFVYDLTGDDYTKFEAYVGMSDEKAVAVISLFLLMEKRLSNPRRLKVQMAAKILKRSRSNLTSPQMPRNSQS
ncbi:NPCBM/NEW2 domain-containing protein [Candidatus Poribacteria bacterium]|nr:NPCBM/NEW2 domain-containing protein [Candidatus Poribacteria bacterium]